MDTIESPGVAEATPIDTRPITREEFMAVMSQFKHVHEFDRLPLPAFAYEELPEYKDTELGRLNENSNYAKAQEKATPEQREQNMKERLRKKLEQRKALQK